MDKRSKTQIVDKLAPGEQLIWTGKAKEGKVMSSVYTAPYLRNILISYGITGYIAVKSILTNLSAGDPVDLAPVILMLAIGSILPMTSIGDAVKAHKLQYAATDRRLISLNGDNVNSVPYSSIHEAVLKQDHDGFTSLFCGPAGTKLKENRWRYIATMNCTSVPENRECSRFVLYAVDDPEGLKNAVKDHISL